MRSGNPRHGIFLFFSIKVSGIAFQKSIKFRMFYEKQFGRPHLLFIHYPVSSDDP